MTIKNGDLPAMPMWCEQLDRQLHGLTKREYFAAMAMQAIIACNKSGFPHPTAQMAVDYANALLAELGCTK